jgi:hypothetical protein
VTTATRLMTSPLNGRVEPSIDDARIIATLPLKHENEIAERIERR